MADVRNGKMAEPPFDLNAPPMIAGRLLIYDLDEEPPNAAIKAERGVFRFLWLFFNEQM